MREASESRPLRFCMVSIFYPPYSFGGDGIYLQRLARELVQRGHEVDVIHCADSYRALSSTAHESPNSPSDTMTIHRLESGLGTIAPLLAHQTGRPILQRKAIERIFASKEFDVIHFHNVSLFGPGVFEIPAKGSPVRLMTLHDHWLVCPTNVMWKGRERACDEQACAKCAIQSGRPPQWWRYGSLMSRAVERVDRFIAPSRSCADKHREYGFAREIDVIPYFVPEVRERAADSPHPRPYYLFAGRLEDYKGVQTILPHFVGEGAFDLIVAGSGPYETVLRMLAKTMPRVHFTGWAASDALSPYYDYALAVIVPSLTYETFGLVQVEAFAHSTPAIVNNLGPLAEINRQAGCGLVYNDAAELAAHLDALSNDTDRRNQLGANARGSYLKYWTASTHLDAYESLITSAKC